MSDQSKDSQSIDVGAEQHSEHFSAIDRLIKSSPFTDEQWAEGMRLYGVDLDDGGLDPVVREELKRVLGGGTEGLTDRPSDEPDDGAPPP
jgi:hypothetical protein